MKSSYARRYGLIRTLAPLHVGASAGEETGNLNLIFRDAYTRTGIIPGSSVRGRFRAELRQDEDACNLWYGQASSKRGSEEGAAVILSEARVKFEHASLVWIPVFSPGQPIVWVSSPRLLKRYAEVTGQQELLKDIPESFTCSRGVGRSNANGESTRLFFNLGFMTLTPSDNLTRWRLPNVSEADLPSNRLVVVSDASIGSIHDMALYRQSRVRLQDTQKLASRGGFFGFEAIPEGSLMVFPVAIRRGSSWKTNDWAPFGVDEETNPCQEAEVYFGGLESVGCGRCEVKLSMEVN
ncbi:type III-B CRISPR module RAMP protein Cmr4 [Synechococcus sp. ATX 2A4]|uniref:RAMP superfamily CRISPR-associated protein n=1 Tax=Synechococcus sp. ATX 2A4 TaxID=2823727 RepID=UPI0020CC94F5|nr:RAMP superfamily CRISPR-associated protein [Synechococcus sp. ATX 2A4]MCP9883600.1 type III-B CRISPR module RAMP protein Cmr4 [Synechococcus sp. ATX 2A4]